MLPVGNAAHQIARSGVARTYQTSQLFGSLSVEDNVVLATTRGRLGGLMSGARIRSADARERSRQLLAFCGYRGYPTVAAADLSLLAHFDAASGRRVLSSVPRGQSGGSDLWGRAARGGLGLTRVPSAENCSKRALVAMRILLVIVLQGCVSAR